ncbi:MAG: ABC transporter ATP-binding protein, partial [Elusimicrobiota bacterium]
YKYPDGTIGLNDINLTVRNGEVVTLIGANGTGKSTLLLALMGIIEFSGTASVFDIPVLKNNMRVIRSKMNLVFQNPDDQLFSPTVREDIAFGPLNLGWDDQKVDSAVTRALETVRMKSVEDKIPQNLSYGEKKRVALATILAMEPEVILLDEPTAGLDPRSAGELIDILYGLNKNGTTLLVATHDLHTADELASRVVVLNENKTIVAEGNSEEILNNHELLLTNNLLHRHIHRHNNEEHVHEHTHFQHERHHKK